MAVPQIKTLLGEALGDRTQRLAAHRARGLDRFGIELQHWLSSAKATRALARSRDLGDKVSLLALRDSAALPVGQLCGVLWARCRGMRLGTKIAAAGIWTTD